MKIEIKRLTQEAIEQIDQVAKWQYKTWGKESRFSYACVKENITHSLQIDRLPMTYIALVDDAIAGYFQLSMADDLEVRPDLYPWLINLYVDKKFRHLGVADKLLREVPKIMKQAKLSILYLYTTLDKMFEKYGWEMIEQLQTKQKNLPKQVKIYKLENKKI